MEGRGVVSLARLGTLKPALRAAGQKPDPCLLKFISFKKGLAYFPETNNGALKSFYRFIYSISVKLALKKTDETFETLFGFKICIVITESDILVVGGEFYHNLSKQCCF